MIRNMDSLKKKLVGKTIVDIVSHPDEVRKLKTHSLRIIFNDHTHMDLKDDEFPKVDLKINGEGVALYDLIYNI